MSRAGLLDRLPASRERELRLQPPHKGVGAGPSRRQRLAGWPVPAGVMV